MSNARFESATSVPSRPARRAMAKRTGASLLERLEQTLKQPGTGLDGGDEQVLLVGVGTVAVHTQAVEGRQAHDGGEIAIGAAAGARAALQREPQGSGHRGGLVEQHVDVRATLGRAAA